MTEPPPGNDWQRWRGRIDTQLGEVLSRQDTHESRCAVCRSSWESKVDLVHSRITKLEVKVAWIAGAAAALGAIGGAVSGTLLKALIGG